MSICIQNFQGIVNIYIKNPRTVYFKRGLSMYIDKTRALYIKGAI